MDPMTLIAEEVIDSSEEELDDTLDMRLAEDPLPRVSLEFSKLVIEADLAAEQSSSVFDRCSDQFDFDEDDYSANLGERPTIVRQRRAQSMQLPTGRGQPVGGIRAAFQQLYSRSYRVPSDTARSLSTPEPMTSTGFADKPAAQEAGQQETRQVVRWAKTGIPGATKLYAGWLRQLPKSKVHVQYDDCSLWKRRYVTLVRQNRRGPFWKDALLVYHKRDEADSTALGFVSLSGALVFTTREDENGAAFHVIHTINKDGCVSLAADSLAERQRWLAAIEKAGVRVKSIFC